MLSAIEPVAAPFPALRGAEIAAVFSGRRGGDFYDVVRVSPSRVLFGLVDLHSRLRRNRKMPSALRRAFCDAGTQLLKSAEANELPDALIQLCVQLNRFVIERGGRAHSCPAFGGCFDEDLGTVCYFNAGHTPGLVRHSSGVSALATTSLPLGLFSHNTPHARMIALEPGAVLLLVSRSVVAADAKGKGEEYGLRRVRRTLKNTHLVHPCDICTLVLQGMQGFARKPGGEAITALALIRQGSGA